MLHCFNTSGCVSSFPSELYYATVKIATGKKFYDLCGKGCVPERWTKNGSATRSSIFPPLDCTPPSSSPRTTSRLCCRSEHWCETEGHINAVLDTFPFLHPCEDIPDATVICRLWFSTVGVQEIVKNKASFIFHLCFFKNAPTDS